MGAVIAAIYAWRRYLHDRKAGLSLKHFYFMGCRHTQNGFYKRQKIEHFLRLLTKGKSFEIWPCSGGGGY